MRYLKFCALGLAIAVVVLSVIFIYSLGPKNSSAQEKSLFAVSQGESRSDIAMGLSKQGYIRNSFAFFLYSRALYSKILPGTYEISASMSGSEIAGIIGEGRVKKQKITLIEGWRASQIGEYLAKEKLTKTADFTEVATKYEGTLFPDTYEVKVDITSDELVTLLRDNFTKRTEGLKVAPDALILASIVEREAQNDEERPQIAAIYLNRLKVPMRLEADPTVQYAKGNWAAPTVADYHSVISPYNTYLNDGLPPGPICNPGLASIKAALNPTKHDYIYFFHAKGQIYFSKTLEEHRAKVKQYF